MEQLVTWRDGFDQPAWARMSWTAGQLAGGHPVIRQELLPWRLATKGYIGRPQVGKSGAFIPLKLCRTMQIIESFIAITHRVIDRDGFDEYLPTLMLPATQDVLVLEGASQDPTLPAIARRWAEERAGDDADFLLAYKMDGRRFAVVARLAGVVHEQEEWREG